MKITEPEKKKEQALMIASGLGEEIEKNNEKEGEDETLVLRTSRRSRFVFRFLLSHCSARCVLAVSVESQPLSTCTWSEAPRSRIL